MPPALDISQLTMAFGGLRALDKLDLFVDHGEIVALIGPNGAGKTTLFNCITGIYKPTRGTMTLTSPKGVTTGINSLKPNRVTEQGLARTFQNIRLFQNMTVLENIMIGRHCRLHAGIAGAIFRNPRTRKEEQRVVADSFAILQRFQLDPYVNEFAKNLPYGAQRRLEIARAMASEPFLLLLDEPAAGMNPQETRELDQLILELRERAGVAILLIEHDMKLVMSLSDRVYVVDYGRKIAQGTPKQVSRDPAVIGAYLGEGADA